MIKLTDELRGLYNGYPGDVAWEKFVSSFPEIDKSISELIPLDGDMARVIYSRKGEIKWVTEYLKYQVPAFDKHTPLEIMTLPEGRIILRTALMRMH